MDKYRVDLAELLAFIDRLQSFDSRAEETVAAVDDLVAQLHGQWLGQAADAHRARHDEWMAEMAAMRSAVMELHKTASGAHTNYSEAISANVAIWR